MPQRVLHRYEVGSTRHDLVDGFERWRDLVDEGIGVAVLHTLVTDNRGAARLSAAEVKVRTYSTGDLLSSPSGRSLDADTAWDLVTLLRSKERHVPGMPESRDHFDDWIQ